jgi:hypothetical protein
MFQTQRVGIYHSRAKERDQAREYFINCAQET